MKKVQLHTVTAEGFKAFTKRQEFSISNSVGTIGYMTGLNKVNKRMGGNAVGKSSIFDAVVWCLYGKTIRGLKAGAIKSWNAKKGSICSVELLFSINGTLCTLRRTWSPNSLDLQRGDGDFKSVAQDVIDDLIGLDHEEFCTTVCIGQFTELFLDYKPTKRALIFSSILPLDRWSRYSDIANKATNEFIEQLDSIETSIATYEDNIETLATDDLTLKRDAWEQQWEKNIRRSKKQYRSYASKAEQLKSKIKSMSGKIETLAVELEKKKEVTEQIQQYLDTLRHDKTVLVSSIAKSEGKLESLTKQLKALKSVEGTCTLCFSKVNKSHKKQHVLNLNSRIEKVKIEQERLQIQEGDVDFNIRDIRDSLQKSQAALVKFKEDYDEAKYKVSAWASQYRDAKDRLSELKDDIRRLRSEKNPYDSALSSIDGKIAKLKSKIAKIKKRRSGIRAAVELHKYWVKGFKDIRLFLINEVLLHLEVEVNNVLAEFGMEDWKMAFAADKVTASGNISKGFTVNIYSPDNTKPIPWESWSGGESQRLRLAAQLGLSNLILNRKGVYIDVQIFDEPTTYLSGFGIHDLVNILKQWAVHNEKTVWLIDHRTLDYQFDRLVKVVKSKNGSEIVE